VRPLVEGATPTSEDRQMSLLWFITFIVVVACFYAGYRFGKHKQASTN